MKALTNLILGIIIFSCQSYACIGTGEEYQVNFKHSEKDGEIIVSLTEKKSKKTKEILDDVGIISSHLAITHIVKSSEKAGKDNISKAQYKDSVSFLLSRANFIKKVFLNDLTTDEKKLLIPKIDTFIKILNEETINISNLIKHFDDINTQLYDLKITVQAKTRNSPDSSWSEKEVAVRNLGLPTYLKFRGGCNADLTNFNPIINPKNETSSDKPNLPTFEISQ